MSALCFPCGYLAGRHVRGEGFTSNRLSVPGCCSIGGIVADCTLADGLPWQVLLTISTSEDQRKKRSSSYWDLIFFTMFPFPIPVHFGDESNGRTSKFIFALFIFGVVLFCAGILLSIFGFQACQAESFSHCSMTLKVLGPCLAVLGMASVLLAKSRARLYLRQRQLQGEEVDTDNFFLCGESNQFAQFLTFGFLFLTSGVLISVLGMWVPGCSTGLEPPHQGNKTITSNDTIRSCGFLSLQIMGPLIVLVGLSFFAVAHIKKKHILNEETSVNEEPQQETMPESFQITVGDAVLIFPPPPPPYFADPLSPVSSNPSIRSPNSENPPSYNSIFNSRSHFNSPDGRGDRGRESIYTISMSSPSEILPCPYFSSDPPPKYEEKEESTGLPPAR